MTGMAPEYLGNKFIFRGNINERVTRSSQKLNIPLFKTKTGQRSFFIESLMYGIIYLLKLSLADV